MFAALRHAGGQLYQAVAQWLEDDADMLAASVAYYTALAFFPLLLILTAALGVMLEVSPQAQDAQQQLLQVVAQRVSPNLATQIQTALAEVQTGAVISGPLGLLFLLIAAMGIFVQFQRAFDQVWRVPTPESTSVWDSLRHVLIGRLRAFAMLVGVGVLLVAAFVASMVVTAMLRAAPVGAGSPVWHWIQVAANIAINALLLAVVYRALPRVSVGFREALAGGVLVAIVWEIGRAVLAAYVIGGSYTAYGVIGAFLALMLWVYYAYAVLFLGAEYVQVLWNEHRQGAAAAGAAQRPAARPAGGQARPGAASPGQSRATRPAS